MWKTWSFLYRMRLGGKREEEEERGGIEKIRCGLEGLFRAYHEAYLGN